MKLINYAKQMLTIVLLLTCALPATAESWSHQDNLWSCSNGIRLSFPPNFPIKPGPLDSISCDGNINGQIVTITFIPAQGQELRRQGLAGLSEMFDSKSVKFPANWEKRKSGKVTLYLKNTHYSGSGNLPGTAKMGVADKGEAHLIFMMLLPDQVPATLQKNIDEILNSIQ